MFKDAAYETGLTFKQLKLDNYYIDFIENPSDILFVTFEGSAPKSTSPMRMAWGADFLSREGFSVLGIKSKKIDWYRGTDLHDFFSDSEVADILKQYSRVIFYGYSMGAFGALNFSSIHDGAEILCYAPITTLDPKLVPWETRFDQYSRLDWTGRFGDAAKEMKNIKNAYVVYDPFCGEEKKHVERLPTEHIKLIRCPFMDHEVANKLNEFGLLKDTVLKAVDGSLEDWFPGAIRARKASNYYRSMLYLRLSARALRYKNIDLAMAHIQKSLENDIENQQALKLAKMMVFHQSQKAS